MKKTWTFFVTYYEKMNVSWTFYLCIYLVILMILEMISGYVIYYLEMTACCDENFCNKLFNINLEHHLINIEKNYKVLKLTQAYLFEIKLPFWKYKFIETIYLPLSF